MFRAYDTRLARPVALKMLHPHLAASAADLARFEVEGRIAAGLSHPRIVPVLDAGRDGAVAWLAVELVEGATVAELVGAGAALGPGDALRVLRAVLDALAYVHAAGRLHLDLSANNVMIDYGEAGPDWSSARVLDVGGRPIAEVPLATDGAADKVRLVRASPGFASPEVATGMRAGPRADLYSAGALLHLLLTGRPPFERDDPRAVLEAQVHEPAPRPSATVAGLGAELDGLVLRAMEKDPSRRYTDADEMAAAVSGALARVDLPLPLPRAVAHQRRAPASGTLRTEALAIAAPAPDRPRARPSARIAPAALAALLIVPGVVAAVALGAPGGGPPAAALIVLTPSSIPVPSPSSTPVRAPAPVTVEAAPAPPETVVCPDLIGLGVQEARSVLESLGLTVGEVSELPDEGQVDRVLSSYPASGEVMELGAAVGLVVSTAVPGGPTPTPSPTSTSDLSPMPSTSPTPRAPTSPTPSPTAQATPAPSATAGPVVSPSPTPAP